MTETVATEPTTLEAQLAERETRAETARQFAEHKKRTWDELSAALGAISPERKKAEQRRAVVERELADELITYFAGMRPAKPDTRILDELRNEADVIRIAIARLGERLATSKVASLLADAELLVFEADVLEARANIQEQATLAALGSVVDQIGFDVAIELRDSDFQKLRRAAAEAIEDSRRLREQASALQKGTTPWN